MKKVKLLVLALILGPVMSWAQQDGINYQASVRDAGGALIINQNVAVNFKVRQTTAGGTVVYEETHNPLSNGAGIVNVVIGSGSAVTGAFGDIMWGDDAYFLDITINGTGIGAFEFKSVPYAHHAQSLPNVRTNEPEGDVHITSTTDHAKLHINPTAAAGNDSSSVVFGEGTNADNNMAITYDGVGNDLIFHGRTAAYPELGPYLTINRDSGTSTFAKGVVVEETTDAPAKNTMYGNSGPLAYAYVQGATTAVLTTDYGVASVTTMGTGVYQIVLDRPWTGSPVVMATSLNNSADTEIVTYNTTGNDTITVRIVDETNTAIHSNVSIVVFGTAL